MAKPTEMNRTSWLSEPAHSELGFKIRHLMISNVSGSFKDFQVQAKTSRNDFTDAIITLTANVSSVSTGDEQRDGHLRTSEFFDTGNYPEIKFVSTGTELIDDENFILYGQLTMLGIAKPVKLQVAFGGIISDPRYGTKAGFTVIGKIKRSDWGLSFNRILDTGGVGLGEEVQIFSELQLVKQV